MLAARDANPVESPPGLQRAVRLLVAVMNAADLCQQHSIPSAPRRLRPIAPIVVSATAYLKHSAHRRDPKLSAVSSHERVLYLSSLAKYAAAFFRMSRSSLTRSSSLRRRAPSSLAAERGPLPGKAPAPCFVSSSFHL